MQLIDINLGNRSSLDDSLDLWNAMYEMRTEPRNTPWPNAANVVVPIIPSEVDGLVSRVTGTVLQPRLITVRGNDPQSSQYAHLVEQFLNAELLENEWDVAIREAIHLTARDGTAIGRVFWELNEHSRVIVVSEDELGPSGSPILGDNGKPQKKKTRKRFKFKTFDAPKWTVKELRDFLIVPNFSPDFNAADMLCDKIYMGEEDCMKLVEAGWFRKDKTEACLSYVSTGQGDLSYDRQGYSTYTINNRINVVDTAVAPPDGMKMTRGPIEVWMCLTKNFDFDGDGVPEENFVWVHDRSRMMMGYAPFEYLRGCPYFDLAMWPRPKRIYGFGVPERLAGLAEEATAQHNQRLDWMDMSLQPMRYRTQNVRFQDEDRRWGPDSEVQVQNPTDFGFVAMPDVPPSSEAEEKMILQYVQQVMGAPQTASLQPNQGNQRTARAAQIAAQQAGMQQNLVNTRVREWILKMIEYSVGLYLQYGPDQLETVARTSEGASKMILPKEILGLDYTFGVAGLGGPFDKEGRRQDLMMLYQLLTQNPLVNNNLPRVWAITRAVVETFDVPEVTAWIGTLDEAQQQAQQMAQAQQQQMQMEMVNRLISTGGANQGGQGAGRGPRK